MKHQLVGNLETGEQFDLGPTDGEWAYLYFAMSQAGDAIAVAHPHAAKLKAHPFVAGQPKFTDPIQVERGRKIADFILGHDNRERLRSLGPGPASHLWLAHYEHYGLFVFDTAKKTGKVLSLRPLGADSGQVREWGVVPGTNRLYFRLEVPPVNRMSAPIELWTAELGGDGKLTAAKKIMDLPMRAAQPRTLVWEPGGKGLYHFDPKEPVNLAHVSTDGIVSHFSPEVPLGPGARLIDVLPAADGDTLNLLFEAKDKMTFQPVRYSLKSQTITWTIDNRFGPSEKTPFFSFDGKRVVYQRNFSVMESRALLDADVD